VPVQLSQADQDREALTLQFRDIGVGVLELLGLFNAEVEVGSQAQLVKPDTLSDCKRRVEIWIQIGRIGSRGSKTKDRERCSQRSGKKARICFSSSASRGRWADIDSNESAACQAGLTRLARRRPCGSAPPG
jgi:hypothetical protein